MDLWSSELEEADADGALRFCAAYLCHRTFHTQLEASGRPRQFCSNACKQRTYRLRASQRKRYETIAALARERDSVGNNERETRAMERSNYIGDGKPREIPWNIVKRSSQAKRMSHLSPAEKRARQVRSSLFRIWSMRDRLDRSALGPHATDLLRRMDDQERILRRELQSL